MSQSAAGQDAAFFTTLPELKSGWHVDQAIINPDSLHTKVVVIQFGDSNHNEFRAQLEVLAKVQPLVWTWADIYWCDYRQVPDFNFMYELGHKDQQGQEAEPFAIMFFFGNKHIMCDFGTGNNNKLNFAVRDKQEIIDIIEVVRRGAQKGRGLVVSPKDYSTSHKY